MPNEPIPLTINGKNKDILPDENQEFDLYWKSYGIRFVGELHRFALLEGGLSKYAFLTDDNSYTFKMHEIISDFSASIVEVTKKKQKNINFHQDTIENSLYEVFAWTFYYFLKDKYKLVYSTEKVSDSEVTNDDVEMFNLINNPFCLKDKHEIKKKLRQPKIFKTSCELVFENWNNSEDKENNSSKSELEESGLKRYWNKRFYLFSRYDAGVLMDMESWYSVTPEIIAEHQAKRCSTFLAVDPFCGCGGNIIQFSKTCNFVIAGDIDENKIKMAVNNSDIYECNNNIDFVIADALYLLDCVKSDFVFFSPPWGGPSYRSQVKWSAEQDMSPSINQIYMSTNKFIKSAVMFLPASLDYTPLFKIANQYFGGLMEIEKNNVNKGTRSTTVYFGEMSGCKNDHNNIK